MANQWFKFFGGEYLSDLKILQLDGEERSCWVTLLCLAGQSEDGQIKFLSEKQLTTMSGVIHGTPGILKKLEDLGMIRISNGIVTLTNWEKRQYSEGYSRVKAFRKRQSNSEDNDRIEENRIDKNRIEESKDTYGEFLNVFLSKEEYQKLIERLGEKNTHLLIEELSGYLASSRKKYLSHYATILNWARRKYQEHSQKKDLQVKKRTIA